MTMMWMYDSAMVILPWHDDKDAIVLWQCSIVPSLSHHCHHTVKHRIIIIPPSLHRPKLVNYVALSGFHSREKIILSNFKVTWSKFNWGYCLLPIQFDVFTCVAEGESRSRSAVTPSVCLSVRLSVRPSVPKSCHRNSSETTDPIIMKLGMWIGHHM